ncbi:MAG: hypothetical protein RIC03_12575 [Cyclobacteriaceae bacterium]
MNKINFHPSALIELLTESPEKVSKHTMQMGLYYREAYHRYNKTISADDLFDHQSLDQFLQDLQTMVYDISQIDGQRSLLLKENGHMINILPIYSFIEKYPVNQATDIISTIGHAMVEYVHDGNCTEFRLAYKTLLNWQSIFEALKA